eukprot:gene4092-4478_t
MSLGPSQTQSSHFLPSYPSQHSILSNKLQHAGVSVLTSLTNTTSSVISIHSLPPPPISDSGVGAGTGGGTGGSATTTTTANANETLFQPITAEDQRLAMLGYKDLNKVCGTDGLSYYREELCGACGMLHSNPDVLDTYHHCDRCHAVIRPIETLQKRYNTDSKQVSKPGLEVLFASYGDPYSAKTAKEVTRQMKRRLRRKKINNRNIQQQPQQQQPIAEVDSDDEDNELGDSILFTKSDNANEIFGFDPSPGENKQLRLRYRLSQTHFAMLILDFNPQGRLPQTFLLTIPKVQYLRIYKAKYGHPKGFSSTGRMSFNVQEILQSLVDQNNGYYLSISCYQSLKRIFGDPCPGYTKDLTIQYEILGKSGEGHYDVIEDCLTKKVYLASIPRIAPILFVKKAIYGMTPRTRKEQLDKLNKEIHQIERLEHLQSQGIILESSDYKLLLSKNKLMEMKNEILQTPCRFYDITKKIQEIIDIQQKAKNQSQLILLSYQFDPNFNFGNPCPGYPKIIEIELDCPGHDSEKLTKSEDMTETGYSTNSITIKQGYFNVLVYDEIETGKGKMQESIEFQINSDNTRYIMDVTANIQALTHGEALTIPKGTNLTKLFRNDPSPGRKKQLRISYISRGYRGNLRIREKDDYLVAGLELGYPPQATVNDDDANHRSGTL